MCMCVYIFVCARCVRIQGVLMCVCVCVCAHHYECLYMYATAFRLRWKHGGQARVRVCGVNLHALQYGEAGA